MTQSEGTLYVYISLSVCRTVLGWNWLHLSSYVISLPTSGPISLWAGLSSSDRKNTILSGNCKGTRGESGPLGDLQAHRPRPLAAHTHPLNLHPTQTSFWSMGTPNTHTHMDAVPFLGVQITSLHRGSSPALSPCLPADFCSVINRLSFHLNHNFSCKFSAPPCDCVCDVIVHCFVLFCLQVSTGCL